MWIVNGPIENVLNDGDGIDARKVVNKVYASRNSLKASQALGPYTVAGPPIISRATPSASAISCGSAPARTALSGPRLGERRPQTPGRRSEIADDIVPMTHL